MIQSYVSMWKNFANFNGRARRRDFWMAFLMNMIVMMVLYGITIAGAVSAASSGSGALLTVGMGILGIYGLALIIPFLSLSIRRLHDTDKSGWFYLLSFVPIGNIVVLVFFCTDGTPGTNRFGEDPKGR